MDEVDITYQEYFDSAPSDLQSYILSPAMRHAIDAVIQNQPLNQKQIEAYGVEVMLVLLRIQSVGSFAMNIKRQMEIAQSRAEEIARQTKQVIFTPVEPHLIPNDTAGGEDQPNEVPQSPDIRPAPASSVPVKGSVEHSGPETEYKKAKQPKALDIFEKRLTTPVHTSQEEEKIGDSGERVENTNPSSHDDIAKDPYKETIE